MAIGYSRITSYNVCYTKLLRAAEVEVAADAAGDDVAEEARKGVLLPGDVGITDALHDILGDRIGDRNNFV